MSIVLVHGLAVSHRSLARLRRLLPAAAPDLAGSSVDALARSLEPRVPPGSLLVGHSLGCQVAAELAVRRPELVDALLLVGPTWDPASPTVPGQLARLLNGSYREPPSLLPVLAWEYLHWGPARILRTARSMLRHPVAERLAEVTQRTIVVRGARDPICGAGWARSAAEAARAPLVEVPGAAHAVQWSHPEVVQALAQRLVRPAR